MSQLVELPRRHASYMSPKTSKDNSGTRSDYWTDDSLKSLKSLVWRANKIEFYETAHSSRFFVLSQDIIQGHETSCDRNASIFLLRSHFDIDL